MLQNFFTYFFQIYTKQPHIGLYFMILQTESHLNTKCRYFTFPFIQYKL